MVTGDGARPAGPPDVDGGDCLDQFLTGQQATWPSGSPSRWSRATIEARRTQRFTQTWWKAPMRRRRVTEQSSAEQVARSAIRPSIDRIAFLSASKAELAQLRREIAPLARRLAARLAADQRHGKRGQLDFRRTVRVPRCPPEGYRW